MSAFSKVRKHRRTLLLGLSASLLAACQTAQTAQSIWPAAAVPPATAADAAIGRIHPAFLWGGILLMLSLPLRFAVARLPAWMPVAEWLTR